MTGTPGFLVLVNGAAGSTGGVPLLEALSVLAEAGPTEVRWADDPRAIEQAIADAGDRRLVVAGGDGTVHALAGALCRPRAAPGSPSVAPVGLLPAGTGNDFARNLGLPLDPVDAAAVVVDGRARKVPVLEVEDGPIVANNLHLGVGVTAARRAARLKRRLGRFAYPVATLSAGLTERARPVRVEVDGTERFAGHALAVLVLMGPSVGGGVELLDDAALTELSLEVVVVAPAGPAARLRLVPDAVRGALDRAHAVERVSGEVARIEVSPRGGQGGEAAADEVMADVDGELMALAAPVEVRLCPDAWSVLAPT